MADAIQLWADQLISATETKGPYTTGFSPMPVQRWFWRFELDSGSGDNTLHILPKQLANYEDDSADQQLFEMDDSDQFDYPSVVTSGMVTDAGGELLVVCDNPNVIRKMKFTYTYLGAGSQVFKITTWVD